MKSFSFPRTHNTKHGKTQREGFPSMKGVALLTAALAVFTLNFVGAPNFSRAQSSEEISDDGWEVEVSEDHGHFHGSSEKTAQVTVWGDRFEIFLEHPYVVAETPTAFVTHVTNLEERAPRREGSIEYVLRFESEPPVGYTAKSPDREGIYIPELTFPKPGTWTVSIAIPVNGSRSVVELPPVEVFASPHDIEHEPDPEEIEGISFLKEQQWKFPFHTEVLKTQDGQLLIPEQSVVQDPDGPRAFVHVAGETVQEAIIEIGDRVNGKLEIRSGLNEGDRVVVRGADAIAVAAASDEGHGHAHPHDDAGGHPHPHDDAGDHGHDHGDGGHDHGDDDHDAGAVHLSEEMSSSLGLTTAVAQQCDLVRTLDVYGWVRPRQESVTEVRSPVTATVHEIFTTEGETLEVGSPLVSLRAREILEWQRTILDERNRRNKFEDTTHLLVAEGRAKMAELVGGLRVDTAEVHRIASELDLIQKAGSGSVAQREVNKTRGQLESARASLEAKRTLAEAYGLSKERVEAIQSGLETLASDDAEILPPEFRRQLREIEFNLQSSITNERIAVANLESLDFDPERLNRLLGGDAGAITDTILVRATSPFLVTKLEVRRQASLNPGDPILTGVDYDKVLIDAEIPEVDIEKVLNRDGDTIPVRVPALDDRAFEATVRYFDTAVHSGDRKAHLVLELQNTDRLALREGMAVSVGIPVEVRSNTLTIPKDAILTEGFEKIVFLAEADHYHRQPVAVGMQGFEAAEILEGLSSGDSVVVSGAPALLLSLKSQEGSLNAGHGHPHPH